MIDLKLIRSFLALSWLAILLIIVLLCAPLLLPSPAEEPDTAELAEGKAVKVGLRPSDEFYANFISGKKLFKANCAQCHNKNMQDDLTGPALAGLLSRWADFPEEDLFQWIRNSQSLIDQGHPRAIALWNSWKPTEMTSFLNLTDKEISDLLIFIEKNT